MKENGILKEAKTLLAEWCNRLLEFKVNIKDERLYGGLLCPACSMIHGRCSDLALPLIYLYSHTKDEKYKKAAVELVEYSENNLLRPDGTYYNDVGTTWRGISVFSALALGETLLRFGELLDADVKQRWETIFTRLTDASVSFFESEINNANVNYYAGLAALLALRFFRFGKSEDKRLAELYEIRCRESFDESGLLCGEGGRASQRSAKGCSPIDIGYNLEESLPLLINHARWLGDGKKFEFYTSRVLDHLKLMLPDGGIDNSFGTRMNKWTYYGSRTSDGIPALIHVANENPIVARAVLENLRLLKRCTHDGLLFGGPMQISAGEPPCIHHTFTHAKALTEFCLEFNEEGFNFLKDTLLPREQEGVKLIQGGNVALASFGGFCATVNASDIPSSEANASCGGALSLLWHKDYGAILCATLHSYYPSEPANMQYLRGSNKTHCMTARFVTDDGKYSSDTDMSVLLDVNGRDITARSSDIPLSLKYTFSVDGELEISIFSELCGFYLLPIVSRDGDIIQKTNLDFSFSSVLHVESDTCAELCLDGEKRFFNQVGGFRYAVLKFPCSEGERLKIKIKINR